MSYERDEAARVQDATESMIRMRGPRRVVRPVVECLCISCREVTLQPASDPEDQHRKFLKMWFCGCRPPRTE